MSDIITHRFTLTVGSFIRGHFRKVLKESAFNLNLTIDIDEENGWLESLLIISVTGERNNIVHLINWINSNVG